MIPNDSGMQRVRQREIAFADVTAEALLHGLSLLEMMTVVDQRQ
jgi:hypothetical protein